MQTKGFQKRVMVEAKIFHELADKTFLIIITFEYGYSHTIPITFTRRKHSILHQMYASSATYNHYASKEKFTTFYCYKHFWPKN